MTHTDAYMTAQYMRTRPALPASLAIGGGMSWPDWRAALSRALQTSLGYTPAANPPLCGASVWSRKRDGYTLEKFTYQPEDGLTAPFYRLIPDGASASAPAVMAICGHGYGARDIVGLEPDDAERVSAPNYHKDFAVSLVKRGFVVYAPELLGFGELRLAEQADTGAPGRSSCERIASQLLLEGRTLLGVRVHQVTRLTTLAMADGRCDPARVGMMGISGGGMVTTYTAALDPRIKACVVSGYANTYKDSIMGMHHCACNFLPGILRNGEMSDYLTLIAPRPMLWEAGTKDNIFPIAATLKCHAAVQCAYDALGASDKLDLDVFEGNHQISGAKSFDFLARWL